MPYKPSQCRLFGAKADRGENVPKDWKQHCRKSKEKREPTRKRGKRS